MSYLLDSNVCSEFIRGNPIVKRQFRIHASEIMVSSVTAAELYVWGFRSTSSTDWLPAIRAFLELFPLINFDSVIAERFGQLRAEQLDRGRPLPAMDLLIAATALAHQTILVTHNQRDFLTIAGLQVVDWQSRP